MKNINKKEIKLIVFDLWQTLVDIPKKPISEIYNICQPKIDIKEFIESFKNSDIFTSDLEIDKTFPNFLSKYPETKNYEDCVKKWKEFSGISFFVDNAEQLIQNLSKEYKLILCSDTDKYGFDNFKFKEIFPYFEDFFLSYKLGLVKSNIEFWNKLKNKYSNLSPENILVVGDSVKGDINPAKTLGFQTFQVDVDGSLKDLDILLKNKWN